MFFSNISSKITYAFAKVRFLIEIRLAIFTFSKISNAWISRQRDAGHAFEAYQGCGKVNDVLFGTSVENG